MKKDILKVNIFYIFRYINIRKVYILIKMLNEF